MFNYIAKLYAIDQSGRFLSKQHLFSILSSPISIALAVTALFSLRYVNSLPFSGFIQAFNAETIATLVSYLTYAGEPVSFPLGSIKGLTFPFEDANVGNVGAVPLFAIGFKILGQFIPYFQTFNYVVLIYIVSCFITAYFVQKILSVLGVRHIGFLALGALLTGTSLLIFTRTAWLQPFCVVAFPLYTAWMFSMLLAMQRGEWRLGQDFAILSIYPIAALLDNYTLFGMLLGTSALLPRVLFEAFFGGLQSSWNRFSRLLFYCIGGVLFAILALYAIGMFPLPSSATTFTSYDFGAGGRYHVADLFSPLLPVGNLDKVFLEPSLLGGWNFPVTTDILDTGQAEGVAYIGTASLFVWIFIATAWLYSRAQRNAVACHSEKSTKLKLVLYSPWKMVGIASSVVFVFSLGYELHIFGHAFKDFSGMPAAWIADRIPSVYNLRATGRLASLLSLFLVIESIRQLFAWFDRKVIFECSKQSLRHNRHFVTSILGILALIHLVEIVPFLKPVPAQPLHPIGGIYSTEELVKLRHLGSSYDVVLISPSWREGLKWQIETFSLAYYLGLRSNLGVIARTIPEHNVRLTKDLDRVIKGEWDMIVSEYGSKVLFAIPLAQADTLRSKVIDGYEEVRVGEVSLWAKRKIGPESGVTLEKGK